MAHSCCCCCCIPAVAATSVRLVQCECSFHLPGLRPYGTPQCAALPCLLHRSVTGVAVRIAQSIGCLAAVVAHPQDQGQNLLLLLQLHGAPACSHRQSAAAAAATTATIHVCCCFMSPSSVMIIASASASAAAMRLCELLASLIDMYRGSLRCLMACCVRQRARSLCYPSVGCFKTTRKPGEQRM